MVENRPSRYARFYGENYGWQPRDKFKEVTDQVKSSGIEFSGWYAASGRIQGWTVTILHDTFKAEGMEELMVEIIAPNRWIWEGTLVLESQTGVVHPHFSQRSFGGEVTGVGPLHPRNLRQQSLAVSSILNFVQEAIPQVVTK